MTESVGTYDRPTDAAQRVQGTLEFVGNLQVPGVAHARLVRSFVPHGRIQGVDVSGAEAMPGVLAVITGDQLRNDARVENRFGTQVRDQPVLADEKVRYAGEAVAVVVAETRSVASAAALMVDVQYDELDPIADLRASEAAGGAPVHAEHPDNVCASWRLRHGDAEAALGSATRTYSSEYRTPSASHVPLEAHTVVARWTAGRLEVWTAAQAPYMVRDALAAIFSLPGDSVVVRTPNLGGAFGSKGDVKIEPVAAVAALYTGRPVKLELDRDEVFLTVAKHAAIMQIRSGVNEEGELLARQMRVEYDAGAYATTSPLSSGHGLVRAPGPYRVPHVSIDSIARFTNTVPTGPFRGSMANQVAFAYECELDDIAADLGIDPVDIRRRNCLRTGDAYATGEVVHDMVYAEILDALADAVRWEAKPEPRPGPLVRGKGLAIMIKSTITPSRSEAIVELRSDGTLIVHSSSVEMGQGARDTIARIAASLLSIPRERVEVPFPDTSTSPFDTITASSRTTFSMGTAVTRACRELESVIAAQFAAANGLPLASVRASGGRIEVEGPKGATQLSLCEAVEFLKVASIRATGVYQSEGGIKSLDPKTGQGRASSHWHQGGAAAEVEIDTETGALRVVSLHGAVYAGRVVSPVRVAQQLQGGAIFGLGPTMFEELVYDNAQLTNPNMSDYTIPSILDVPATVSSVAIESDSESADMHGVGEMVVPAIAPAVNNAVRAAVGVRIYDLPLTPERILNAIRSRAEPT